jgi:hypothetical protein
MKNIPPADCIMQEGHILEKTIQAPERALGVVMPRCSTGFSGDKDIYIKPGHLTSENCTNDQGEDSPIYGRSPLKYIL